MGGVGRPAFFSTAPPIKAVPPTVEAISPLAAAQRWFAFTAGGRDYARARVSNGRRPCVLRGYIRILDLCADALRSSVTAVLSFRDPRSLVKVMPRGPLPAT